jgi:carboxypeptidase C (cathepsin A)
MSAVGRAAVADGGHYCPALATSLLEANDARPDVTRHFQLHGVAIGDGLTDPQTQVLTKPDAALAFGLIGTSQHACASGLATQAAQLAANGSFVAAKARREAMEAIVGAVPIQWREFRTRGAVLLIASHDRALAC